MSKYTFRVPSVVATLVAASMLAACASEAASRSGPGASEGDAGLVAPNPETVNRDGGTDGTGDGSDAGNGDGGLDSGLGQFAIKSCQPAFEAACKPPITFVTKEPNGRGKIFTDAVPNVEAAEQDIACTACSILYRDPSEIPADKHPSKISVVLVTSLPGGNAAQAGGEKIDFSLVHIAKQKDLTPAEITQEMLGVLLHETVHLYQNYGNRGTGEGLADLVRAQVGYYRPYRWAANEGTWKDAYTASGNFYSWLTGPSSFHSAFYSEHDRAFPYKLNKALAGKSGDDAYTAVSGLIEATFGKNVDTLWDEYQATAF